MAKRLFVLASAAVLVSGLSTVALATGKLKINDKVVPIDQLRFLDDPPASHTNGQYRGARADTVWFGYNGDFEVAEAGGIWDFEMGDDMAPGSLQGWESVDLTDQPIYVRRVTRDDQDTFNNPVDVVITGEASMWFGAFESEATAFCWPGGQGYGNGWGMIARKTYAYTGSGDVQLTYNYFVDSETGFDYSYVYVEVDGIRSIALNTSANPDDNGVGYSGDVQDFGAGIGLPEDPAGESITIDQSDLPTGAGDFDIVFNFDSDPLYSDQLDSSGSFMNSESGPFGVDDVQLLGTGLDVLSTFESGTDGWLFDQDIPIGNLLKARRIDELDPIADPCVCPITADPSNEWVMIAAGIVAEGETVFPHPKKQNELLISPAGYVGPGSGVENNTERMVIWDVWEDTPQSNGVGYSVRFDYFPWTCDETAVTGWTIEPAGDGGFIFSGLGGARCTTLLANISSFVAADIESIRIVYEVLGDCDDFGTANCTGPDDTNQSPYWDNVRIGLAGLDVIAPIITRDIIYQDCFPRTNSLFPNSTARVYSQHDNNRADTDPTNANMGDSCVVIIGEEPLAECYLNFRVYPGPSMDTNDNGDFSDDYPGFYGDPRYESGNALAPSWARARMDTAEVGVGIVAGSYSTYFWPDGQEDVANQKIVPDDLLTPGTLVEYFFSALYSDTPDQVRVSPDTTDAFFLEFEVLPGFALIDIDGPGGEEPALLVSPFLYVDAFNAGAQVPIEDYGLRPYLGEDTDEFARLQQRWDRYDYFSAGGNTPAPLAREAAGDNGMTRYQSLAYECILYNTGTFAQEGLRNGDADLLVNWLTNDDFDRFDLRKGLWLSGNGMASILNRPGRASNNALLSGYCKASVVSDGDAYRDIAVDSTFCVRLDPAPDGTRHFPLAGGSTPSYSSVRGNGCPTLLNFQVIEPLPDGDAQGNLRYVRQSSGGTFTDFASVSNDQFAPGNEANYGVVLDAFSLHYMRRTADGWTEEDCGQDSTAITQRVNDVLSWFGCVPGWKSLEDIQIGVEDDESSVQVARTMLFQNSPNPFNPRTTVRYTLAGEAAVRLQVFDVNGRLVRTLVDGNQVAGDFSIQWDGTNDTGIQVGSGVYWARMSTSRGFSASTKMVVLK